jgi:hypothetical protein
MIIRNKTIRHYLIKAIDRITSESALFICQIIIFIIVACSTFYFFHPSTVLEFIGLFIVAAMGGSFAAAIYFFVWLIGSNILLGWSIKIKG